MAKNQPFVLVAVFHSYAQADQAINALLHAGFRHDQISLSQHTTSHGGFIQELKKLFLPEHETDDQSIVDSLTSMGVPLEDANAYQREYQAGHAVLTINTENRYQEALTILQQYEAYNADTRSSHMITSTGTQTSEIDTQREQVIQIREEQLQVDKQPAEIGEVRVWKEVTSEQRTLDVPITREEISIERRHGSGQVSHTPIGESEIIRIPIMGEQVTTYKQVLITGEISLGKRQVQEMQQISDTLQHEEVHVEREGNVTVQGDDQINTKI